MNSNPDIYEFFDYREYLKMFYESKKASDPDFSHRSFLKKADITGAVYLQRVLRQERKLMPKFIPNFSRAIGHNNKEAEYFKVLVLFGNEKDTGIRESLLKQLLQMRYTSEKFRFEDKKLKFYEKWYVPVLRELAPLINFQEDYNLLSASIIPRISPVQAKNGIKFLVKNGFLKTDDKGRYERCHQIISTGDEVHSVTLAKYHQKNLSQSIDIMDKVKRDQRDISSLTLSVSTDTYFKIKEEVKKFRKKLLAMAAEDENADMVAHAAFQLFPRSKPKKGKKK